MHVIVNTDKNITLTEDAIAEMVTVVEKSLEHFERRLSRVEIHLSDESAGRETGDDIRCRVEARPEGRDPEFATDESSSVDGALSGALRKMQHVLESTFGRLDHRKGNTPMGGSETA